MGNIVRKVKFCFDCDDTLYDLSEPFARTLHKHYPDAEWDPDEFAEMYTSYRGYGDEVFEQLQDGRLSVNEAGIIRAMRVMGGWNLPVYPAEPVFFQQDYVDFQQKIYMPQPLKDYFKESQAELAVITNGNNEHQRRKCERLGVFDYFPKDHVFTSGELGVSKPEADCFKRAFERMGEDLRDWYYIGDNYINDMEGAKAAGMKTIHFNRHYGPEGPAADYVVYTDEELAALLRRLEKEALYEDSADTSAGESGAL